MNAMVELYHTLVEIWRAADLAGHLREWWWVVRHPDLLDGPPPQAEVSDA